MFIDWTKHLKTEEEKEQFRNQVKAAKPVLDRLKALIDEREAGLDKLDLDPKSFNSPGWPFYQASRIGAKASTMWTRKLIDLDKQVTTKE